MDEIKVRLFTAMECPLIVMLLSDYILLDHN